MALTTTRATALRAFEDGVIDTPQGAFIGSFSIATVQLLLSSLASEVVPVCRQDEVDVRYVLAETDTFLPEGGSRNLLPFRKSSGLPCVTEWRVPGVPLLFTPATAWHSGSPLRSGETSSLSAFISGYRFCDPTQVRIRNGVVYRKTYRGWRPVRDLQRAQVSMDRLLLLASALGVEVECGLGWTFSRWLEAQVVLCSGLSGKERDSHRLPHTAA